MRLENIFIKLHALVCHEDECNMAEEIERRGERHPTPYQLEEEGMTNKSLFCRLVSAVANGVQLRNMETGDEFHRVKHLISHTAVQLLWMAVRRTPNLLQHVVSESLNINGVPHRLHRFFKSLLFCTSQETV